MYRSIYTQLLDWKKSIDRKPLILLGARQVGKTWIMKHFGQQEYTQVAYVNCDEEPRMKELFSLDYDLDRILLGIQAITGIKITPSETLLILDEIQETPRGLHCLKYFYENAPQYHVMVAGSLLGITLNTEGAFPVGKVNMLRMYPMTFEEFLEAMGETSWKQMLESGSWELISSMHPKFVEMLRQYYYVGGMPEAVAYYAAHKDLAGVRRIQSEILIAYRNDIAKHTTNHETIRIGQVLDSLPSQLVKENKKFVYGAIRKGARATDFELAIQWLMDAGIIHKVKRVREVRMPLKFYEDLSAFKLFLLDCGLLACMSEVPAQQILLGNDVFVEFKGAFTEQFVLQQLVAKQLVPYYWSNNKTPAEIDFVVQQDSRLIPIEVKAEQNVRAKSLAQFIKNNPNLKGLRVSMLGYVNQNWMENIPLYAIERYFR